MFMNTLNYTTTQMFVSLLKYDCDIAMRHDTGKSLNGVSLRVVRGSISSFIYVVKFYLLFS